MCGIAGVIGGGAEAEAQARELIEPLRHRGPDGIRVERAGAAALAHARLSIIDLECGWQPLTAAGSTVIGNGEIYNYVELVEEHGLADRLRTGSDFEPLLHLYAREGEKAFGRLRGMYAFCLVGGDGRTWLVRDPFGIKPLYVAERDGELLFASETRALPRGAPDPERAAELLALNYTLGRDGLAAAVSRLAPGEVRLISSSRAGAEERAAPSTADSVLRLAPSETRARSPSSADAGEEQALAALDAVLEDSVRVHQRSDVPYGLFLSGGIDSSAIATLMARLNARPVTAYT
ncbi:MAG: asparagine synthase-related protein, partial [Pseudomonadota bacterium]|nr:asparagine synthase-related protein [Pseudomonadota bacterium]